MISKYSALHRAKHNRFLFPVAFLCIYLSMRITFVNLKEWNFNFQSSQKISPVHAFRISTIPFWSVWIFGLFSHNKLGKLKTYADFSSYRCIYSFYFRYSRPNKGSQRICFACEILDVTSDVNLQLQNWRGFRTSFVTSFSFFFLFALDF